MDIEATLAHLLAHAVGVDQALLDYVQELSDVGEGDLGLITLLEIAPRIVPESVVAEMDAKFRSSGDYAEREAINAIDSYRRRLAA